MGPGTGRALGDTRRPWPWGAASALLLLLATATGAHAQTAPDTILAAPDSLAAPSDSVVTTPESVLPPSESVVAAPDTIPPLPPPEVRAWQTGLFRGDRVQHFTLSVTLGVGIGLATREAWAGGVGSLALGFGKEVVDRRTGRRFDLVDLAADALGAAIGALIVEEVIR